MVVLPAAAAAAAAAAAERVRQRGRRVVKAPPRRPRLRPPDRGVATQLCGQPGRPDEAAGGAR
jgi:hypothetical protein